MRVTLFRLLLVLIAGAVLPLAFSPFNWFWIEVPALALLFGLWHVSPPGRAMLLGWMFGIGMFGVGVSWVFVSIHDMGHLSVVLSGGITVLLVAALAMYPAVQGWASVRLFSGARGGRLLLVFPASWVLFEWLRGVLFTGFSWLWLGHSQVDGPLIELLPIFGSLGASWVVAFSAGALVYGVVDRGSWRWLPILGSASVWLLLALTPVLSWTVEQANAVTYSLVQGGRPQQIRWEREQRNKIVEDYLRLTESEWGRDLVVWPENALPLFYHQLGSLRDGLNQQARSSGTVLFAGMPFMDRDTRDYFNSIVVFPEPGGRYDKHHLVPFTEFLPLKAWLKGLLEFFEVPMSDFTAGAAGQPPVEVAGVSVGISICYEVAFARDVLVALPEARILVNVSNDGWFGDSLGPHQHLQIARVRALEAGRPLLRATNTGITAQIDYRGRVVSHAPRFEPAVLRGVVYPMAGSTPYVRWGDWPVLALMMLLLGAGFGFNRRR